MLGDYQMRIDLSFGYGCVALGNQCWRELKYW